MDEHSQRGYDGRFGPGLPRVSDGSLLFLLHLVTKMRDPREGGSRIGIILNGSPLFTGGAGLVQLIDDTKHFSKMRKSLGSKRQYVSDGQIGELVRSYGAFAETETSKIFPATAFGYRRITVERPLRLSLQVTTERIQAAMEEKAIRKMDASARDRLASALHTMDGETVHSNRDEFVKILNEHLATHHLNPSTAELKALIGALGERDPEADICKTRGKAEPDSGLRDYENVPLEESVHDYFDREVRPHVPDAWIDESKTNPQDGEVGIVGYEIPFNCHFYVFTPPRPLEEIDRDLKECTDKIRMMIEELSG